jgi:hypothetical protein
MTSAERRTACIKLLAEDDQLIAEREDLADRPILADDEREYLAVHLSLRPEWRERVEKMLARLDGRAYRELYTSAEAWEQFETGKRCDFQYDGRSRRVS